MTDCRAARMARVRQAMADNGLELLLTYSDGRHSLLACDGVMYLTGFKPMAPSALLLPRDDEPTLVVTPASDVGRARRRFELGRVVAADDFPATLERVVRQGGLAAARTALVGSRRVSRPLQQALQGLFPTPLVPFDGPFERAAQVRDELELDAARLAVEVARHGYSHLLEQARPGMTEYELAAEVDLHLKRQGAEDVFLLLSSSQHHLALRPPGDRRLDVGDIILAEISPCIRGQFVQICRSAVLGEPSALQRERHRVLVEALRAGMQAGVPGARVRDVVEAMNAVVRQAGFGRYCAPPYMRVRGHGLGLGSTMPGDLRADNETELVAGMMFVVHPNQYLPDVGYLLVGETVVVTEAGLRPLAGWEPALDSIGAVGGSSS